MHWGPYGPDRFFVSVELPVDTEIDAASGILGLSYTKILDRSLHVRAGFAKWAAINETSARVT